MDAFPSRLRDAGRSARGLERVHELPVVTRDRGDSGLPRHLSCPEIDEWIPEARATNGKANEAWNAGRRAQPFVHLAIVLTPAEHDATRRVAAAAPRRRHNGLAVR